jgi:type II secretory pathway pseudopilin PulG
MKRNSRQHHHPLQQGIVLLGLLIALAISSIGLMAAADVWATSRQREREQELLFVGGQYRKAIERYYFTTPGQTKALPASLEDLLEDKRFPAPVRHLRRLYADPMTDSSEWGTVLIGSKIAGVYSKSDKTLFKQARFDKDNIGFEGKSMAQEWKFVFMPAAPIGVGKPIKPGPGNEPGAPSAPNTPTKTP